MVNKATEQMNTAPSPRWRKRKQDLPAQLLPCLPVFVHLCYLHDTTLTLAIKTLAALKKPHAGAGDRSFTIGDKTRAQLLQGRKYNGSRTKMQEYFVMTIHPSIELFLRIKEPLQEAFVKAEIKPPGQRHPHVWAQEALATDIGSRGRRHYRHYEAKTVYYCTRID
ncbi:hypothetical protein F9C07_2276990 [Aspergillus flavus]|uniref:Uncharacterized protein n=2 Tax=Aspergillus subgen. Circumdati TaxID=2720871 RepID=A0A7U2MDB2_ASPFN|nr:unnamed protein product [Aspergillus oryzae RIB40]QRD81602.1 hypothetical protein F9C07_2276990 [Aspergillus flavus]BAE56957.1 unnamed protein product [Aspergillus oryzae RIB40]